MKKKHLKRGLATGLTLSMLLGGTPAVLAEDAFAQKLRDMYNNIEIQYRPDVRWWLAEGLNTDATLKKNIQEIYDSGFGAAEFLAMPEPGAEDSIYGWGSEEWTADSRLIIEEATKLGLGFSLTSGTHWANANLPDTYSWGGAPYNADNKAAAKELDYATIHVKGGETFSGTLPTPRQIPVDESNPDAGTRPYTEQLFQGVAAARVIQARPESGQDFDYKEGTDPGVLDFASLVDLTGSVTEENGNYVLNWTAPSDGDYALFIYWMHGSAQTADPSVSTNYTVNYIDKYGIEALIDYWEEVVLTPELKETIRKNGRGEIYMDSLELSTYGAGGIFWGYDLKEEFKNRMGYDITPYLPVITARNAQIWGGSGNTYDYEVEGEANKDAAEKARADYFQVRTELYEENVLKPLQEWLHSLGMTLRAEPSYGQSLEISTPAKYLDGVEIESLEHRADIELYRGLAGAANMYNRLYSSETGAVAGHNYIFNMDDFTQLCYMQFAEGINRTVFHGYSAIEGSEADTYWPGHEGMYAYWSERFNSRQPASSQYPDWTEMLARNQKVLRQGTTQRDIAILRTDYLFMASPDPDADNFTDNRMLRDETLYWRDFSLQQAGYTYDYFSPMLLTDEENVSWTADQLQPDGASYQALVLYQEYLDTASANKILEIAKDGLPVVFVNNNHEIRHINKPIIEHETAASRNISMSGTDEEIQAIVTEIKALGNVREVDSAAEAMSALQELGVYPRVSFEEANDKIITAARLDRENNIFYTFAYSYRHTSEDETPFTFTVEIDGEGAPYAIDDWTGEVTKLGAYEIKDGRTCVELNLQPGQAQIIALDLNAAPEAHAVSTTADSIRLADNGLEIIATQSGDYETVLDNGETVATTVAVPDAIHLSTWNITVEDWNEGEKMVNTEEKFGHTTTEVYYTTKKTPLSFENASLAAWKDLPATEAQLSSLGYEGASMDHVSGVGTYETSFTIPEGWAAENGAFLSMESAGGGIVSVYVNGEKAPAVNTRTLTVDISDLIKVGENELKVVVASSLTNRMNQRNYEEVGSYWAGGWSAEFPEVQSYGLQGEVKIVPYTVANIG